MTGGNPLFTLSQVALNDAIMVFAFAPIVALLLGLSSIIVPWDTLLTSVVLYIVIPVVIAQLARKALVARGPSAFEATLAKIGPWSVAALLATLVLLFAFQGEAITQQQLIIAMLAVPIVIQVFFNSALAYGLNRAAGEKHDIAGPSALIGACNFFELAVAAAISLFGFPFWRSTGHRCGCTDRGAGHAVGRACRQWVQGLVRAHLIRPRGQCRGTVATLHTFACGIP